MVSGKGLIGAGFFFLFEIKGEEKEDKADAFIGQPLQAALEEAVASKIVLGGDLHAMIPDDLFQVLFCKGSKSIVTDVEV